MNNRPAWMTNGNLKWAVAVATLLLTVGGGWNKLNSILPKELKK